MVYLKVMQSGITAYLEASISFMPKQLQSLFVTILIFGQPAKPLDLWEKYKEVMAEEISQNCSFGSYQCAMLRNKDV